jgi:hypothetical protein
MKLSQLSGNKNQITLADGTQVLFSYQTPVAAWVNGEFFKTSKRWSNTTTRHINSWVHLATEKPQEYFDTLVKSV